MSRSRRKAASADSTEAERSWGDVVCLGETIVAELGLTDSNDTLGRWMAHRLAELMKIAESAKSKVEREAVQEEAANLIIALWEHRAGWPKGWPPKATAALTRDQSPHARQKEPTGSPWLDSLSELERLHAREREIWVDLGLLDFDVESERRAAKELIGEDAKDEREAIELVIQLWESAEVDLRKSLGDEVVSPKARGKAGLERLTAIDSDRRKLRERILGLLSEAAEGATLLGKANYGERAGEEEDE